MALPPVAASGYGYSYSYGFSFGYSCDDSAHAACSHGHATTSSATTSSTASSTTTTLAAAIAAMSEARSAALGRLSRLPDSLLLRCVLPWLHPRDLAACGCACATAAALASDDELWSYHVLAALQRATAERRRHTMSVETGTAHRLMAARSRQSRRRGAGAAGDRNEHAHASDDNNCDDNSDEDSDEDSANARGVARLRAAVFATVGGWRHRYAALTPLQRRAAIDACSGSKTAAPRGCGCTRGKSRACVLHKPAAAIRAVLHAGTAPELAAHWLAIMHNGSWPALAQRLVLALPPWSAPRDVIPRVPLDELRADTFRRRFDGPGMPVVITGATGSWPARHYWRSFASLASRCPPGTRWDIAHRVGQASGATPRVKSLSMSLEEYASYCATQCDEMPLYVFDARFGEKAPLLLHDYSVSTLRVFAEDIFEVLGAGHRPDFRWLIVGPTRGGTPWHVDPNATSAWNALLSGRKRWALYPPDHVPPGVHVQRDAGGRIVAFDAPLSPVAWFAYVYPHLSDADKPYEVLQHPGDVVYIPAGWWHMVLNVEDAIAVTQNFVSTGGNLDAAVEDLATALPVTAGGRARHEDAGDGVNQAASDLDSEPSDNDSTSADMQVLADGDYASLAVISGDASLPERDGHGVPRRAAAAAAKLRGLGRVDRLCACLNAVAPWVRDRVAVARSFVLERAALVSASAAALRAEVTATLAASTVPGARLEWSPPDFGVSAAFGEDFTSHAHLRTTFSDARVWFAAIQSILSRARAKARGRQPRVPMPRVLLTPRKAASHAPRCDGVSGATFQEAYMAVPSLNVESLEARGNPVFVIRAHAEEIGNSCDVVVKLFSPYVESDGVPDPGLRPLDAIVAWRTEVSILASLSGHHGSFSVPRIIDAGFLRGTHGRNDASSRIGLPASLTVDGLWRWPYIVSTFASGQPLFAPRVHAPRPARTPHGCYTLAAALAELHVDGDVAAAIATVQAEADADRLARRWDEPVLSARVTTDRSPASKLASPLSSVLGACVARRRNPSGLLPTEVSIAAHKGWHPYICRLLLLRESALARHTRLRALPPHLLATLDAYLPPADPAELARQLLPLPALRGSALPCALHGDVTESNVRVAENDAQNGVDITLLDFADAIVGDPLYELLPIAVAMLELEAAAITAFVSAYHAARAAESASGCESDAAARGFATLPSEWPLQDARDRRRATVLLLLHPVNGVGVLEACPRVAAAGGVAACACWAEVEALLWG